MTISKFHSVTLAALTGVILIFSACKKDDDSSDAKGQLNMEITDSPADDPNVKAVFVTVAEVKVDGQTFSGFSGKKTINLLAYQQGSVAALGLGDLKAGTYQNITLVLDMQTDAGGNAPGTYVQTYDNVKHVLSSASTVELTATKAFEVKSAEKTNLVLDFDLRKAVMYQSNGGQNDQYDFVANADLQASLRVVVKNETGTVSGVLQNNLVNADKVVAYAYKKGTFNRNTEIQASNGVAFKNAVASTIVNSNGEFKFAFLNQGDYEVYFAAYKDITSDEKLDFLGTLVVTSSVDLGNLNLNLGATLTLSITVIGILP